MLQMISFAGGMVLAVISAFRADLSTLYLFGMITFLLIMWFESRKIQRKFQNTFNIRQQNIVSLVLLLIWGTILFIPLMQLPAEIMNPLAQTGINVPWYRAVSWWNTWAAPFVYLLLWMITWLLIALNLKEKN